MAAAPRPARDDAAASDAREWFAPPEDAPHSRTWMAWPAREDIWGPKLTRMQEDVASIARAIARFEPVALVARPDQEEAARAACGDGVEVVPLVNDDLWMRDIGPIFLVDGHGGLAGLDMNFNGWGAKQIHANDATIAGGVLEWLGVPRIVAPFVAEGGALEFDGRGTVMATESSIVNANRNPGKSKAQLTAEICRSLGARKMTWVPGLVGHDITDCHIDALARFAGTARVVVDQPGDAHASGVWAESGREALRVLAASTDADGSPLVCRISPEPGTIPPGEDPEHFVSSYVNWYVCNGAVLVPKFGDPGPDRAACALAEELYPTRTVVQLAIDGLAAGGGGIHCATQQQPSA